MQRPGWDSDILKWCLKEDKDNNLKPKDYIGGFVIDEMKIQVLCNNLLSHFNFQLFNRPYFIVMEGSDAEGELVFLQTFFALS